MEDGYLGTPPSGGSNVLWTSESYRQAAHDVALLEMVKCMAKMADAMTEIVRVAEELSDSRADAEFYAEEETERVGVRDWHENAPCPILIPKSSLGRVATSGVLHGRHLADLTADEFDSFIKPVVTYLNEHCPGEALTDPDVKTVEDIVSLQSERLGMCVVVGRVTRTVGVLAIADASVSERGYTKSYILVRCSTETPEPTVLMDESPERSRS